MRFKRLVSGIAALTVAMGTFATMTITASAAIEATTTYKYTFYDTTNGSRDKIEPTEYTDAVQNQLKTNTKVDLTVASVKSSYWIETVDTTGTEYNMPDGKLTVVISADVNVHKLRDYTFTVKKSVGGAAATTYDGLQINSEGFSKGVYTYQEGSDLPSEENVSIKFPRFTKGSDDDIYELSEVDTVNAASVTRGDANSFAVTFNPKDFATKVKNGNQSMTLSYRRYSRPTGVPSDAKFVGYKDFDTTSDNSNKASNAAYGDSSVSIGGDGDVTLKENKKYYFVVTHTGTLDTGNPFAPAFLDTATWKDEVLSAVTTQGGIANIKVTGGNIDTVLVFSTEVETFNLNITATGVDQAPQFDLEKSQFVKGDPSIESVTYSYPRYVQGTDGNLYKATGESENGVYSSYLDNSVKYTKTIKGRTLSDFSGTGYYNVTHSYSEYHYPGVTGDLQAVVEATATKTDPTASNGKCAEFNDRGSTPYSVTTPGKYTLVVRHKNGVQVTGGANQYDGTPIQTLEGGSNWKEEPVTVTVKQSDLTGGTYVFAFKGTSSENSYVDTILVYKTDVKSTLEINQDGAPKTFNDVKAGPAYTAWPYQATLKAGTESEIPSFGIAVKVGENDSKDSSITLNTTFSGDGTTFTFGVIAPEGQMVSPYVVQDVE